MNTQEFRHFAKVAVDYIADYFDTIRERGVMHSVQPGYIKKLIPNEAPEKGESWQKLFEDIDRVIMPGLTHWHSPNFHAYFAAANSFPAVVGEMMAAGFTSIGLDWTASPVCTELEAEMMDWLAKLLGLPQYFLNSSPGSGGGVLQTSASEATFLCLLAAREKKVQEMLVRYPYISEATVRSKLVAYSSDQSNSSVEKAGLLSGIPLRLLPSDSHGRLEGSTLVEAIMRDKCNGLIPFYVVACLGTTPTCAFDKLSEIGPVCLQESIWIHVDAAYAGAALSCPEYRYLMNGIEFVDSFSFSPHKWMLVNYDCSAMWLKNSEYLTEPFNVDRVYIQSRKVSTQPEYRHWQIPLGRKFRSLKLWFVFRVYGVKGIQDFIRKHVSLAKYFEALVKSDNRFEVISSTMALVCFRLKGDNALTNTFLKKIYERKHVYITPACLKGQKLVRFAICGRYTEKNDVEYAWDEFLTVAEWVSRKHQVELL